MGMRNLFNNYFYGRPGQRDYTQADLPRNRKQLFHEVLRARRGSLIGLNLLYLLCWIPAILWSFLNLVQLNLIAAEGVGEALNSLLFTYLLLLWPMIALTGPFDMGISYVLRNWARDEHSFPFLDFKSALRANWKQGLLFGAINGLVPLAAFLCAYFYLQMAALSPLFYLPLCITLAAALLWALIAPLLPTMIVTYRQGFGGLMRNALLMTVATLPKAIGVRLLTLSLPILLFVCALVAPVALRWVGLAALILYVLILPALNKLIWASYANALCEKYLNPKIAGARTNIGLHPQEDEA